MGRVHRVLGALGALVLVAQVAGSTAPAVAAPTTASWATVMGEPGERFTSGGVRTWLPGPLQPTATLPTPQKLVIILPDWTSTGLDGRLDLEAADGTPLAEGTYGTDGVVPPARAVGGAFTVENIGACSLTRAVVHQLTSSGSSVTAAHVSFEASCEGFLGRLFGTVSVQGAADDQVLAIPNAVEWPTAWPGQARRTVPVRLVNTSSGSVSFGVPTLSGPGADQLSISTSTCGTAIAAGASCTVEVTTAGATAPVDAVLTVPDSTSTGPRVVRLRSSFRDGSSGLRLRGADQDGLLDGGSLVVVPPAAADFFGRIDQPWQVDVGSRQHHVQLSAGNGDVLAAGRTYQLGESTPARASFQSSAPKDCDSPYGSFTVHEMRAEGTFLQRFSATVALHCPRSDGVVRGTVAYRATAAPDTTPPPPVTRLELLPLESSVIAYWDNPASDWADTIVVGVPGSKPSLDPRVGEQLGAIIGSSVISYRLTPATAYSVTAWARDSAGNLSTPATVVTSGSDLSLRAEPGERILGGTGSGAVSGVLRDHLGRGLANAVVDVYARPRNQVAWNWLGAYRTSDTGAWRRPFLTTRTQQFMVRYSGGTSSVGTTVGSAAGPLWVYVHDQVRLSASRGTLPLGGSVTLTTAVGPKRTGLAVKLQANYGSGWATLSTKPLDTYSKASWTFRPPRRGTPTYRVVAPSDAVTEGGTSNVVKLSVT